MSINIEKCTYTEEGLLLRSHNIVEPGSYRVINRAPCVRLFTSFNDDRSILQVANTRRVYAILYENNDDKVGEVRGFNNHEGNFIELTPENELCLVISGTAANFTREFWFSFDES